MFNTYTGRIVIKDRSKRKLLKRVIEKENQGYECIMKIKRMWDDFSMNGEYFVTVMKLK